MAKAEKKEKQAGVLKGHWLWGALVLCILLLIDLGTKIAAEVYFDILGNAKVVLIPGVMEFTYTENPGMAFSMGADAPPAAKIAVIIGTAVMMLACIFIYLRMDKRRSCLRWCLVFIVAGGIGNLIDRVVFEVWLNNGGGVRDMVLLDFSTLLENWFAVDPTNFLNFGYCNFADFFIVGGAIALIFALFFFDSGAFFPKGKYKALAKEAEEQEKAEETAQETPAAQPSEEK
jgi:signal peptidase II